MSLPPRGTRVRFTPALSDFCSAVLPRQIEGEATAFGLVLHPTIESAHMAMPGRWDVSDPATGRRVCAGDAGRGYFDGFYRKTRNGYEPVSDPLIARMGAVSALIRLAVSMSRDAAGQPVPGGFRAALAAQRELLTGGANG